VVGGEHFGSSLAVGDFDGDGFADLAIGAPEEFGDGGPAASVVVHYGAVQVLYGSTSGLATARNQRFTINSSGFPIDPVFYESSDAFGYALAAGDFNGITRLILRLGCPADTEEQLLYCAEHKMDSQRLVRRFLVSNNFGIQNA